MGEGRQEVTEKKEKEVPKISKNVVHHICQVTCYGDSLYLFQIKTMCLIRDIVHSFNLHQNIKDLEVPKYKNARDLG